MSVPSRLLPRYGGLPMTAAEFEGLTALVTGGASGIGLATAQHLAARGARVTILDRANPRGGAVGQVNALDAVIADVTDDAAVRAAGRAAAPTPGGIDILVN